MLIRSKKADYKFYCKLDAVTKGHSLETQALSERIACLMGLDRQEVTDISVAARYHDIGKADLPAGILQKKEPLSEKEFRIIKRHPKTGADYFAPAHMDKIAGIILYHHENHDGSGYFRLEEKEIPMGARIIHVCDVYSALTSDRPYRSAWSKEAALSYLADNKGTEFDPRVVNIFLRFAVRNL